MPAQLCACAIEAATRRWMHSQPLLLCRTQYQALLSRILQRTVHGIYCCLKLVSRSLGKQACWVHVPSPLWVQYDLHIHTRL